MTEEDDPQLVEAVYQVINEGRLGTIIDMWEGEFTISTDPSAKEDILEDIKKIIHRIRVYDAEKLPKQPRGVEK